MTEVARAILMLDSFLLFLKAFSEAAHPRDERGRFSFGKSIQELRQEALEAFNNPKEEMLFLDYSLKAIEKLFPNNRVQTPLEEVKMGERQFERLASKDNIEKGARKNLIGPMYQTLVRPSCVIRDEDKQGRPAKLYIKSFKGDKLRATVAVVVGIDGIPISVSFGKRKVEQLAKKIKMATTVYYALGGSQSGRSICH